jgi:hypothetical protein
MPILKVEQDRYGNIEVDPVNERLRKRAVAHLAGFGVAPGERDSLIYLQGDAGEEFLADMPASAAREVREGWRVRVRVSSELFEALVGYDAAF